MAIKNGAQGIGLCRTEHMFFATAQRIAAVRRMIAAVELHSPHAGEALAELQKYQTQGEGAHRGVGGAKQDAGAEAGFCDAQSRWGCELQQGTLGPHGCRAPGFLVVSRAGGPRQLSYQAWRC